ncbi:MAG TPA: 5-dehydro-2-deoxygluconokinase [Roseiflexaceae bacterium]|nr:5-dehydro-2-deoxygluconokinase [Roseiflexaceae bacterium]HMP39838.1 5-dehydro-2-deoxygluconokinase [Roseiflexaceae bacterium]
MTHQNYDLLSIGRSSIDLYAHEIGAAMTDVRSFDAYVGGCPTNVSVGTRRLGVNSALLTAIGDDQVGEFILAFLNDEQVETRYIPRKVGKRTSAVILTIQPPDRFPLTFYRENCADIALTIDDVVAAPITTSRIVFLSGTGVSRDPSRSATFVAAEAARTAGATVLVDLDYRGDQWDDPRAFGVTVRSLLRLATLAVGTEEEVRAAGSSDDLGTAIGRLLACGIEALVLKRGERGATIIRPASPPVDVPPFTIEVLNVLGAGDAFASGLIYGMLQGWPLERAARMGCATGAIVVTRHGCANFMPTLAEVEEFVAAQGGW